MAEDEDQETPESEENGGEEKKELNEDKPEEED